MIDRRDLEAYARMVRLISELTLQLDSMTYPQNVASKPGDVMGNYADYCFLLRNVEELLDKLRKEAASRHKAMQATACAIFTQLSPDTPTGEGKYATGQPVFSQAISGLKRTDETQEAYDLFCRESLGITDQTVIESGVISVHFDKFQEWYIKAMEAGRTLPGVEQFKPFNNFAYKTRKRVGVNLLED